VADRGDGNVSNTVQLPGRTGMRLAANRTGSLKFGGGVDNDFTSSSCRALPAQMRYTPTQAYLDANAVDQRSSSDQGDALFVLCAGEIPVILKPVLRLFFEGVNQVVDVPRRGAGCWRPYRSARLQCNAAIHL